jgi:predicted lysophospholipase L1 biosynthesis ABC-type transport system permease subunit
MRWLPSPFRLRAQEIAIRMALGAQRGGIARLILASGVKMALLGCALGVLGSLALSRFVGSFLLDVSPTDPMIYIAGVLIMMLMSLLASALPAARAASADPIDALRRYRSGSPPGPCTPREKSQTAEIDPQSLLSGLKAPRATQVVHPCPEPPK